MNRLGFPLGLHLLFACGLSASATTPTAQSVAAPHVPSTRYRVGDFVVYRYTGAFSREPVLLREQVFEQQGNRLVIEVIATRGAEEQHWIQVVTDTPKILFSIAVGLPSCSITGPNERFGR